jgi:hypothetical protein
MRSFHIASTVEATGLLEGADAGTDECVLLATSGLSQRTPMRQPLHVSPRSGNMQTVNREETTSPCRLMSFELIYP